MGGRDEVEVVLAATDRPWATRAAEWITAHASRRVRLRDRAVVSGDQALAEQHDCLVVDADSTVLQAALVEELHRRGTAVVGVADSLLSHTRSRLEQVGCDTVVDAPAPESSGGTAAARWTYETAGTYTVRLEVRWKGSWEFVDPSGVVRDGGELVSVTTAANRLYEVEEIRGQFVTPQ